MRTSAAGVAFIASHEGFIGHPYRDVVGVWTIGYGHTGPDVFRLGTLTRQQGLDLLRRDLGRYEAPVNLLIERGGKLNQNQYDALVSLTYNCGPGCVGPGSTIYRLVLGHSHSQVPAAMMRWNKGTMGGRLVEIPGLTTRRREEAAIYRKGVAAVKRPDPLAHLTTSERKNVREYDQLKARGQNLQRRRALRLEMTVQRQLIWRLAQPKTKGGDGHGWDYRNRRARYHSLLARTK